MFAFLKFNSLYFCKDYLYFQSIKLGTIDLYLGLLIDNISVKEKLTLN